MSLLAWTTTPWTLPSNLALCVNPEMDYIKIKDKKTGKVERYAHVSVMDMCVMRVCVCKCVRGRLGASAHPTPPLPHPTATQTLLPSLHYNNDTNHSIRNTIITTNTNRCTCWRRRGSRSSTPRWPPTSSSPSRRQARERLAVCFFPPLFPFLLGGGSFFSVLPCCLCVFVCVCVLGLCTF